MLACLGGERAAAAHPLRLRVDELPRELADEGRHVAELAEPAEALQRRDLVVEQALLGGGERQVPGGGLDLGGELLQGSWGGTAFHDSMMDRAAGDQT